MSSIQQDVLQILGSALAGAIATYFGTRAQRSRRVVEYYTTSIPLFNFAPGQERSLSVYADKALVTGVQTPIATKSKIDSAWGHSIRLRNSGNAMVEFAAIEVTLPPDAAILEFHTEPKARTGYPVLAERDQERRNVLRVSVPFLNPGDLFHIGLIATSNDSPQRCGIDAVAKDTKVVRHDRLSRYVLPAMCLGVTLLGILIFAREDVADWLPAPAFAILGGHVETQTTTAVVWPVWVQILGVALLLLGIGGPLGWMLTISSPDTRRLWDGE
jgi:hypothetical protein